MQTEGNVASGARVALGLLLTINLFNYIDRYILAAVLPRIRTEFLAGDPNQSGKAGLLMTAFLLSYMVAAPIFGWLADRVSRWWIIAVSIAIWSLASGWSGLATSFAVSSAKSYTRPSRIIEPSCRRARAPD